MVRSIVAENAKKIIEQKCLKQGAIEQNELYGIEKKTETA